jgi:hypothetical protein
VADKIEYLEHIRALSQNKDPIVAQAGTIDAIAALLRDTPESKVSRRMQPDKWSIVEIIAHLAEDELVTSWRYRQMIESPGCDLRGFDQDLWAVYGRYQEWNLADAFTMFRLLRVANLRMLERLTDEEWQRHGIHQERGRITVLDLARHMAGHDANHLQQIRRLKDQITTSC